MKYIKLKLIVIFFCYGATGNAGIDELLAQSMPTQPAKFTTDQQGKSIKEMRYQNQENGKLFDVVEVTDPSGKTIRNAANSNTAIVSFKNKVANTQSLTEFLNKYEISVIKCMRAKRLQNSICLVNTQNWGYFERSERLAKLKNDGLVKAVERDWLLY